MVMEAQQGQVPAGAATAQRRYPPRRIAAEREPDAAAVDWVRRVILEEEGASGG